MAHTRSDLDSMLAELERDLAMLIMDGTDQEDLWAVFARQAEAIEASANPEDLAYVKNRTNAILTAQGIIEPDSWDEMAD